MTPCLHGLTTSRLRRFKIPDFHSFATSELRRFEIPYLHSFVTSELRRLKIPDLHSFTTSELRRVKIPDLHSFATSELRRFKILDLHSFATSELRRFTISDLHRVNHPENSFHEFRQTRRFEGNSFFLNCPTLAPRGSGLTATIRFHENHWISVKNVTLWTSEWTRVLRKPRNGRIEAGSWNCPLAPINWELSL
jgi:threonyl-tRNA synthetase